VHGRAMASSGAIGEALGELEFFGEKGNGDMFHVPSIWVR
jgi:hypothetical protein